jgi:hypothetical protein
MMGIVAEMDCVLEKTRRYEGEKERKDRKVVNPRERSMKPSR